MTANKLIKILAAIGLALIAWEWTQYPDRATDGRHSFLAALAMLVLFHGLAMTWAFGEKLRRFDGGFYGACCGYAGGFAYIVCSPHDGSLLRSFAFAALVPALSAFFMKMALRYPEFARQLGLPKNGGISPELYTVTGKRD
jgi:hypothetical protein